MRSPGYVRRTTRAEVSECPTLLVPRLRATLLAGTAFIGALLTAMTSSPQSAFAACAGEFTAVTCHAGNQATAGALLTFFAGTTAVNDNLDGKINAGEGEFSNVTRSYAGKGVVRYVW